MLVRAVEACYIDNMYREAGDEFDWKPKNKEMLPKCLETVKEEPPVKEQE